MLLVSNHRKQTTRESTPMHKAFEIKKQPRKVISDSYIRCTWHIHDCLLELAVKFAGSVLYGRVLMAMHGRNPNSKFVSDYERAARPFIDANDVFHCALSETECKRAFDPFRESTKNDLRWLAYAEAEVARMGV